METSTSFMFAGWIEFLVALISLAMVSTGLWFFIRRSREGDSERLPRRFLPGLIITAVLFLAVSVAVYGYSNYQAIIAHNKARDSITQMAIDLLEQLPQFPPETWQTELMERAAGQDNLLGLALVAEEFGQYKVVAAYPDHLAGETVDIDALISSVVLNTSVDELISLESETWPASYVTGGRVNEQLFKGTIEHYMADVKENGASIRGGTAYKLPSAGENDLLVLCWGYYLPHAATAPWKAIEAGSFAAAWFFFIAYWLLLATWVYRDARRRTANALPWGLLALITNLLGLVVYLISFPAKLECPECSQDVKPDFLVCPNCGSRLKESCPVCNRELEPGWRHCPACGNPLNGGENPAMINNE